MSDAIPQLMPLSDWARARFKRPPTHRTLLEWCRNGDIPAKKIGGLWYVEAAREAQETGDPLVDDVLKKSA